jgi:hypothetical protein
VILVGTEAAVAVAVAGDFIVDGVAVDEEDEEAEVVADMKDVFSELKRLFPVSSEEARLGIDEVEVVLLLGFTLAGEVVVVAGFGLATFAGVGAASTTFFTMLGISTAFAVTAGGVEEVLIGLGAAGLGEAGTGGDTGIGLDKTGNLLLSAVSLLLVNSVIFLEATLGSFWISANNSSDFKVAALASLSGIAWISLTISLIFCCVCNFFFSARAARLD